MAWRDAWAMQTDTEPRRLLVVANETCPCPGLAEDIRRVAGDDAEVLIVAPALNSRLRHFVSDVDAAIIAAQERLRVALALLAEEGLTAGGEVGDADPMVAIDDALARFRADALIVSTHPPGRSHWLERNLIERARERFDLPLHHHVSIYGLAAA